MSAYYLDSVAGFLKQSNAEIRDKLTGAFNFSQQRKKQSISWESLINILKSSLKELNGIENWGVLLEYSIPRRSKRIDCVIIANDIIIVIEFKDGQTEYLKADCLQLEDYCLDLQDFHFESNNKNIVPILLSAFASKKENNYIKDDAVVKKVLFANRDNLKEVIQQSISIWSKNTPDINYNLWNNSKYSPTPTIIEAAQTMFANKQVREIANSHADAKNLKETTNSILTAIKEAQKSNAKIICFITGVPGAGKTLAGLNIVHSKEFKDQEEDLGVFLSGNSPLVKVISEALARNFSEREHIPLVESRRKVSTFIQNVHQFIDEYYEDKDKLPPDRVLIYDEAQRAWTKEYKYQKSEKRINASEPEILLSIMNRFTNSWAVVIALVGGGQEINTGEGGLKEWGKSLVDNFKDWKIYVSPELKFGDHSTGNQKLFTEIPSNLEIIEDESLHLKVALRSYKAEKLSDWVSSVLLNNSLMAKDIYNKYLTGFPLFVTRSLSDAKEFIRSRTRGTRRSGLIASSGARRLRAVGLDINAGLKGTSTQLELGAWYLNPSSDVRSSNFLEIVSSEFAIQGLELDWVCLCWDADLRRLNDNWDFNAFKGTKWNKVKDINAQTYLLNTYRVLLTRAREGMVIYVPNGSESDITRKTVFYDLIYDYLKDCGVRDLSLQ